MPKETYNAENITVLEGLERSPCQTGYVYRQCVDKRTEPSDLRDRG